MAGKLRLLSLLYIQAYPFAAYITSPPSLRRRPESSGLNHPFPQSGNDNHSNDNRTRASGKACHSFTIASPLSWIPAFAGMTTGVEMGLSPSRQPLCHVWQMPDPSPSVIPAKAGIQ